MRINGKIVQRKLNNLNLNLDLIIKLFCAFGARNSNTIKDNPNLNKKTRDDIISKIINEDAEVFINWLETNFPITLDEEDRKELNLYLVVNYSSENLWN